MRMDGGIGLLCGNKLGTYHHNEQNHNNGKPCARKSPLW
jgi:hypothetical protein